MKARENFEQICWRDLLTMPIKGDNLMNKLILLFVFDKMEVPISETTIIDMCTQSNRWLEYMDCKLSLSQLIDNSFVCEIDSAGNEPLYSITPNGRVCLADFFFNIPTSTRESISKFVKKNRNKYRKEQEYVSDYYMNKDGTYTVYLKIVDAMGTHFELKFSVPSRQIAKDINLKWKNKAENVYALLYENMVN